MTTEIPMAKNVFQILKEFLTSTTSTETYPETVFLVYTLGVLFLIATLLFAHRFSYLFRMRIDRGYFLTGLKNCLKKGDPKQQLVNFMAACEEMSAPIKSVAKSIASHARISETSMRLAAEEAATIEIPRLQRNTRIIATIAYIAPFLGLFGTILSLINLFGQIEGNTSAMSIQSMAPAVQHALISTAVGIIVSVIVSLYTVILQERSRAIVLDMEKTATELINAFLECEENFAATVNKAVLSVDNTKQIESVKTPEGSK